MNTLELRNCLREVFSYGFRVGLAGFVAILVLHMAGCHLGVRLAQTAFMVGFLPMMVAGVILMVLYHFRERTDADS